MLNKYKLDLNSQINVQSVLFADVPIGTHLACLNYRIVLCLFYVWGHYWRCLFAGERPQWSVFGHSLTKWRSLKEATSNGYRYMINGQRRVLFITCRHVASLSERFLVALLCSLDVLLPRARPLTSLNWPMVKLGKLVWVAQHMQQIEMLSTQFL